MGWNSKLALKSTQRKMMMLGCRIDGTNTGVAEVTTIGAIADTGVKEVSTITTIADTGAFEVSTITTVADAGAFEVATITAVADVAGSLNSTYFTFSLLDTAGVATNFYVWLNVNAAGVDPAVGGATGIEVAVATGATDATVAGAIRTALGLVAGVTARAAITGATNQVIITALFVGNPTSAADGGAATGFTIVPTNGVASNLNSTYFTFSLLNTSGSATNFYVWFNVNSQGVDPAVGGATAIPVAIAAGASDSTIGTALRAALNGVAGVTARAVISGATNQAIITASFVGNPTSVADGAAPTGFTLTPTNGVASNLNSTYFTFSLLNTSGSATNFYAWFNVNGQGVDPAVAATTAVPVAIAAGATDSAIGTALRAALNAVAGVTARAVISGATNQAIITASFVGNPTNIADGAAATGFTLATTTAGVASNLNSKYFVFNTALNAISYYVWLNVNGQGVDPAVANKTGIAVAVSASAANTAVGLALRTAIAAAASTVTISGSNQNCIITNNSDGATTDAVDTGSTGFSITVNTQGVTQSMDVTEGDPDITLTDGSALGEYTLTFVRSFKRAPAISVGVLTADRLYYVSSVSTTGCTIKFYDATDGTTAKDADFHIIAMGDAETDAR